MEDELLTLENLSAWYDRGKNVLSGLSARLYGHEVVGLIGLNGAGKTTLMNTLSGLHEGFSADAFLVHGRPARPRDEAFKARRYAVFAEDHAFRYFTFREYLAYVFSAYRKPVPDVGEWIHGFHFEDCTDVLLKDLSTGSRKKAFLITAFALRPELLLLDEPVNGLDFESTEFLYAQMAGYKAHGTILFASHVLESITLNADRVWVLEEGRIRRTFERGRIEAAVIREALSDERHG